MKNPVFVLLFSLFLPFLLPAQEIKKEIEKAIDKEELPEKIRKHLQQMPIALEEADFYYQKDVDNESYEAKVDYKDKKYTIAFETEAKLRDIEIEIDESQLPETVNQKITDYLNTTFARHKIEKIQLHYNASHRSQAFEAEDRPDLYELVVAIKDKKAQLGKREIRFNPSGEHVNTRKILRKSHDFLIF